MKPFLYGMFTMLVVASVVSNVVLGYLFFNQRAELNSLREQVAVAAQSSSSSTSTPSSNCAAEYTSEVYPKFKFSYDDCAWDLAKQDNAQGPKFGSIITLSNKATADKLVFELNILSVFGSPSSCSANNYERVGSVGYRIKMTDTEYAYYSTLIPRGTGEFNAIVDAVDLQGLDPADVRFCYAPDIPFVTATSVTAGEQDAAAANPEQKLNAVLSIQATVENAGGLDAADEILKTITV